MSEKYDLAAKLTMEMVVEILAMRYGWSLNEALSELSKTRVYELLADSDTGLWTDNPSDIADIFDIEHTGEPVPPEIYFT